jgi:hypothetical protein
MQIQGTYNGRTYKEVTINHNFDDRPVSDDMLIGYAMHVAGETPESLFGWSVKRPAQYPLMAVVTLNTD